MSSSYCCSTHWSYRYFILFFLCSIRHVTNYCVEMPSGLEDTIIKVMKVSTAEYDLLFSVSSWPNIFLCFIGGIVIDRILGLRLGLFIVVNTTLIGQALWAVGGFCDQFYVMLAGRLLIGAGNDLTVVTSHAFKAIWFKDNLSFAMSIDTTFSRVGGMLALLIPDLINRELSFIQNTSYRLGIVLLTAVGSLLVALIFCVAVIIMDAKRDDDEQSSSSSSKKRGLKSIQLEDIKQFSLSYWLSVAINVTYFPTVFAFVSIAQVFFIQKYGMTTLTANIANSLVFGATILTTPIVGIIIDRIGYNLIWVTAGILSAMATHLILAASYSQVYIPFIATVLYSLSYTLAGPAFSPVPALLVKEDHIATAYGIFRSNYNLSFSIVALTTGIIVDELGYFVLELFYSYMILIAFTMVMLLIAVDATSGRPKVNVSRWGLHKMRESKKIEEKKKMLPRAE